MIDRERRAAIEVRGASYDVDVSDTPRDPSTVWSALDDPQLREAVSALVGVSHDLEGHVRIELGLPSDAVVDRTVLLALLVNDAKAIGEALHQALLDGLQGGRVADTGQAIRWLRHWVAVADLLQAGRWAAALELPSDARSRR